MIFQDVRTSTQSRNVGLSVAAIHSASYALVKVNRLSQRVSKRKLNWTVYEY